MQGNSDCPLLVFAEPFIETVGTVAMEALSHIRGDVYFMGMTGVHATAGLSTGDLEEAYMKRVLAELLAAAGVTIVRA